MNASVHSAILGLIQGITEFLPISSSAHLYLYPYITGGNYQGLKFDVMLHMGSLLAILIFFRKDWIKFASDGFSKPKGEGRFLWHLAAATVPAGIAGILLEKAAEEVFRNPVWISVNLFLFAMLLLWADRSGGKEKTTISLTLKDALLIGLMQCLALMPGVSRAGITITAALFLGYRREDSAKISFYLAMPVIAGAGILEGMKLAAADINHVFFIGLFSSFIFSMGAIKFLLDYLKKKSLGIFILYRAALSAVILLLYFGR